MYSSFMQVSPGTIRITVESSWSAAAADYAEARALFSRMPVPGFPKGNAPSIIAANHYCREIRAETIRRCAARLIRIILMEKGIHTVGPFLVLQASLEPGKKFRCTMELLLRPKVTLPDCDEFEARSENEETRRAELKEWLLAHAVCDVPEPVIRISLEPDCRDTAHPGTILWTEAAQNALLHVIAHEVADAHGIEISEERLEKHLGEIASATNTTAALLHAIFNENGQLEAIREYLLVEAALDFLAQKEHHGMPETHAVAA